MREYKISEVRTSGCTAEEEEGGEEGGGKIYIRHPNIYRKTHTTKKDGAEPPRLAGRGGSGGFWSRCQEGPGAEGLADVRETTTTVQYHCPGHGRA